jgi:hypothetical protein
VRNVLQDWFLKMDLESFRAKWEGPANGPFVDLREAGGNDLQEHKEWTLHNRISFTPTFFINGYELPGQYSVNDLEPLIRGLLSKEEIPATDILEPYEA